MTVALLLAAYAVVAAVVLPRVLGAVAWAERAPRLAAGMWQAASASVVVSAVLAGPAFAVPPSSVGHGLAAFFAACADLVLAACAELLFGAGALPAGAWFALAVSGLIGARVVYCGAAELIGARTQRRRHSEMLALLGRHDDDLGAVVVDYEERVAYCLPGRPGQAVITTGALRSLTCEQVAAVLAHERAHLAGRHHLVLAASAALARAFPFVPLFVRADAEVRRLVELRADDVAARSHRRIDVAAALVGLATGRAPSFALGAGGETALARVRRMLAPERPLERGERLAGLITVGVLLAGPAAVALLPGVAAFLAHHCNAIIMGAPGIYYGP
ncbi:Signal transducer regulating beta-lactamase production, contains metallopeptidase domain [Sinosporangium album]|uniref:Signal transducer regulating beta-lactamase production, contains metallopeptidase domain n=1 Tax=Sinosporangium album TaxID=504805 RepID=A0A1G7TGJ9_9ACTN|nr:M56 family metallopeptidase [Sinosporangium album]SDG34433.1 Signal transducer regulating beta-lactamase production, contains metallopeptidase domain [Sinosporangium album]